MALTPAQETALIAILDQANQILIGELTAITAAQSTSAMMFEVELGGAPRRIALSELIQFINTQIQVDLLAGETPLPYSAATTYDASNGPRLVEFTPAGGARGTYLYINTTASAGTDPSNTSHWYPLAIDGAAGASAISNTTATFVQPASGSNVNLVLDRTTGVVAGSLIFHASGNYYRVVSVNSATGITVTNPTAFAATNTVTGATIAVGRLSIAGEPGQTGAAGQSAIANNAGTFVQPAANATVSVTVDNGLGFVVNQLIQHSSGNTYVVTARTATSLTVRNPTTHQDLNGAPASTIAAGTFSPSGFRGATGATGINAIANNAATFVQPTSGSSVTVAVDNTDGLVANQIVQHSSDNTYQIAAKTATSLTLTNLLSHADINDGASTTIPAGTFSPSGYRGLAGAGGADGISSTTNNAASFAQPAIGATVSVPVTSSSGFAIGQVLYHTSGNYYTVSAIPSATGLTLENSAVFVGNAAQTTTIAAGQFVTAGRPGQAGTDGVATGDPMIFTTTAIDANGELSFSGVTVSWHKNTRTNYTFPAISNGDRLILQNESLNAQSASITITSAPSFADPVYTASATMTGTITAESNIRVLPAIRGGQGIPGVDGIATGHKVVFTTGTVDANGEIGGTTTLSIHQNDRDGNLLPLAGILSGSILSIYGELNAANYTNWTLTADLTLTGSVYSATATRVNGGAIADGANARLVIAPRGANGVSGISGVTIALNGTDIASAITRINFVGTNYTITSPSTGQVDVSVAAGGGGGGGTSSGDAVLATAFFRTNGDSNTNDGTNVSALTSLGTSSFTISQSNVANQPSLSLNAFGSLSAWLATDTGSDSTRDSFNISPGVALPATGWTVIFAGTITGNTQILSSTINSHNITIPNGGAITVDTSSGQAVSTSLTRSFPTTYVWGVAYDGTNYLFYEGLNARGSQARNGSLTLNSIGQIQSNIRRLDCRIGTIACWDTLLSTTDREAAINALAARYGITL